MRCERTKGVSPRRACVASVSSCISEIFFSRNSLPFWAQIEWAKRASCGATLALLILPSFSLRFYSFGPNSRLPICLFIAYATKSSARGHFSLDRPRRHRKLAATTRRARCAMSWCRMGCPSPECSTPCFWKCYWRIRTSRARIRPRRATRRSVGGRWCTIKALRCASAGVHSSHSRACCLRRLRPISRAVVGVPP